MRLAKWIVLGPLLACMLVILVGNARSLSEGLRYLAQRATWSHRETETVAPQGPYGILHELVSLGNEARLERILRELHGLGLEANPIPTTADPQGPPSLFVPLSSSCPYTLLVAHYDKSRETLSYQGASDNTAAVTVLLALARDLAQGTTERPTALLFSAAEEQGALGSRAFVAWARDHGIVVRETLVLDMLGRDRLAIRPAADPGFYAWLPPFPWLVYDGRSVYRGNAYERPDPQMVSELRSVWGLDVTVYHRFTAHGDANVFASAGIPTAALSSDNMYYLDLVWERDSDRVELIDEEHLGLAHTLLLRYLVAESTQP